ERMPEWARNTFVVVAAKHKLDIAQIISGYGSPEELWYSDESDVNELEGKARGVILTDDYAPVENLLAPVVRRSGKGFLADKYMQQAQRLVALNRSREAIAFYEKAAQTYPRLTTIAYSEIGFICFRRGDFSAAVEAFKKAIEYNEQARLGYNLARANFELAASLENLDRGEEAAEYLSESSELFRKLAAEYPETSEFLFRLGKVLVKMRDLDAAAEAFKKAVALDPNRLESHIEYARVFELQERYDEGIQAVRNAIEYMKSKGFEENIAPLRALLEVFEFKKWRESRGKDQQDANTESP
ncbi:MAG: tetratricopeptide repeat protein, partial [Sedimentisphaerales bacterium]|nr:tetratricopeptide repeat protein [Sedimentisphaerales bacterium]